MILNSSYDVTTSITSHIGSQIDLYGSQFDIIWLAKYRFNVHNHVLCFNWYKWFKNCSYDVTTLVTIIGTVHKWFKDCSYDVTALVTIIVNVHTSLSTFMLDSTMGTAFTH